MMIAGGIIGGRFPSVVHVDNETTSSDVGSTYTFDNRSFGIEHPKRLLVVGLTASHAGLNLAAVVNSCSIGGVAATRIVSNSSGFASIQIWAAHVPNGTTGTIRYSRPGDMISTSWALWAIYDLKNMTAIDGQISPSGSVSLSVLGKGVAVAFGRNITVGNDITWSGVTENFDETTASGGRYSGASIERLPAVSPLAISATMSGGEVTVVAASWR